jgi:beta-phosphoglucomutase-like phosphatase (HAD superfamily)
MVDAFIFDLDGTLLDSETLWVEAVELLLRGEGVGITHEEGLELVYGMAWPDIFDAVRRRFPDLAISYEGMTSCIHAHFERLRGTRDIRIASSVALLRELAAEYPVCIVSGSGQKDVAAGVALMDVESCLAFYLAMEHYETGKPDPTCFLMAAERLALPPERCLVFEDSTVGVQAAKAAGMHCVALARDDRPAQDVSEADLVLSDLADFSVPRYMELTGG